ncbi:interleukin-15 receptor subunit alpha isoform X1 [Pipistrellus kuhlii]|uniref:interleukin-15 receptor subunit alpha isoform X1 n=1 Tax=Pipistrellus kuhlii TaxID=59472 RepID=UPI001E27069D|nr:interleukin-15 receptor subunit alpha isoform X1 [Pipistrellus kuhlii]
MKGNLEGDRRRQARRGQGLEPKSGTTCATPTSIEHANIQVKSYNENSRERYICNSGFKRKAGTSSLTKCLHNKDTNITQWTIPSLKCIILKPPKFHPQDHKFHVVVLSLGDPSLTHQRPSSTVAPARVTPEPESPYPPGKEPAFMSKPDTIVATKPAVVPGSRLMPSKPPAGTTGVVRNEPSQAPPPTTAKALEHTPSTSLEKLGTHSSNSTVVTVATLSSVTVLCGALLLVCYCKRSRQTSQTPRDQMENMEDIPMTGRTNGREEDTESSHTI